MYSLSVCSDGTERPRLHVHARRGLATARSATYLVRGALRAGCKRAAKKKNARGLQRKRFFSVARVHFFFLRPACSPRAAPAHKICCRASRSETPPTVHVLRSFRQNRPPARTLSLTYLEKGVLCTAKKKLFLAVHNTPFLEHKKPFAPHPVTWAHSLPLVHVVSFSAIDWTLQLERGKVF